MRSKRPWIATMSAAVLLVGLVPAVASAGPQFTQTFTVDCYHESTYVTSFDVAFGPVKNAGTAFHLVNDTSILTSNGYTVDGQSYPPRGLAAVDARGDSVVCTGSYGGSTIEITGWVTPRG